MMGDVSEGSLGVELVGLVASVVDGEPVVLVSGVEAGARLPSGPLLPRHPTLPDGLRDWVHQQCGRRLGHVEQLGTFTSRAGTAAHARVISVSYLGLTRGEGEGRQVPWYDLFPWEDQRVCPNHEIDPSDVARRIVDEKIAPGLRRWTDAVRGAERTSRRLRARVCFGLDGEPWVPKLALQRYELLYEAGLIPESPTEPPAGYYAPGRPLLMDHRWILAAGMSRLRSTVQSRPAVFDLLGSTFTLGGLQLAAEALLGQRLHKQNFRRLVIHQELVEPTGQLDGDTGGRPAQLFRYRRAVLDNWHIAGTRLPGTN